MTEEFLKHLSAEQRCSPHTVKAYGRDLRQFAKFCCGSPAEFDYSLATANDIREWIGTLASEGSPATTLRRKIQALRAFYLWARRTGRIDRNPALDVTLPKTRKHLPNFIKVSELEPLLEEPEEGKEESYAAHRTRFVLDMLYSLGLRQAELLTLTDADINIAVGELRVTGKRNKTRVLPLPEELCHDIVSLQQHRDREFPYITNPKPLIAGPHGAVSKATLYNIVRDGLAGVSTGRKSPHTLRHTFATALVNEGADLDAVREMLGHESLSTTQIYTHLSFKELLGNYLKSHPRAKK